MHLDFICFSPQLLSFVAFVMEEVVSNCSHCGPLYFFEFVSCTAFLFTMLLLILLATTLHQRVGINSWPILASQKHKKYYYYYYYYLQCVDINIINNNDYIIVVVINNNSIAMIYHYYLNIKLLMIKYH